MRKREAFTMIELIFVIVLLGILAAVAIPRLAATRDDAIISKSLHNLNISFSDFASHYTSQGHFGVVKNMTNVRFNDMDKNLTNGGEIFFLVNNPSSIVRGSSMANCISFVFTQDGNLTLSSVANSGRICQSLYGNFKGLNKTFKIGGDHVHYN